MIRNQNGQFFDHIASFRASLGRLIQEISDGLGALHRVQFEEPWKPVRKPTYGEW